MLHREAGGQKNWPLQEAAVVGLWSQIQRQEQRWGKGEQQRGKAQQQQEPDLPAGWLWET